MFAYANGHSHKLSSAEICKREDRPLKVYKEDQYYSLFFLFMLYQNTQDAIYQDTWRQLKYISHPRCILNSSETGGFFTFYSNSNWIVHQST